MDRLAERDLPSPADSEPDDAVLDELSIGVPLEPRSGPIREHEEPRKSGEGRASGADDDAEALLGEEGTSRPKRPRAASFSRFSFDFGRNLLAIPLTVDVEQPRKHKDLGLWSGIGLVVGGQIGSGIFSTPGIITSDVGSVGASLFIWVAGGLLAWTGAATFAELGSAIPLNGGTQAYLNYSYGPLTAYLFSWVSILGAAPGSQAAIALATSEYLCRILYHTAFTADSEESARNIPDVVIKIVGLLMLVLSAIAAGVNNKLSYRIQTAMTALKLISMITVLITGIITAARGQAAESIRTNIFEGSATAPGAYAIALYSALFAYSGWDYCVYVSAEMTNPQRDLPRVLHSSMGITSFLFVAANVMYFVVLEKPLVAHSNTVGLDYGKKLFGPLGGTLFAVMIALSSFGALHATIAALSRVAVVAAQDGWLPKMFGEMHPTRRTPVNALVLYTVVASVYLLIGSYKTLITTFGICISVFLLLAAISMLILRIREPALERPYKTFVGWPLIFSGASIFILLMPIVAAPVQFFTAAAIILSGLPGYWLTHRKGKLSFEGLYSALPTFSQPQAAARRERQTSNGSLHVSKEPSLPRVSEADEEDTEAGSVSLDRP